MLSIYLSEELLLSRLFGFLFEILNFISLFDGLSVFSPVQSNLANHSQTGSNEFSCSSYGYSG